MATEIGTVKSNHIKVLVSEHFSLVRIFQDEDQVILTNIEDIDDLIIKLQAAKKMITNVKRIK